MKTFNMTLPEARLAAASLAEAEAIATRFQADLDALFEKYPALDRYEDECWVEEVDE